MEVCQVVAKEMATRHRALVKKPAELLRVILSKAAKYST